MKPARKLNCVVVGASSGIGLKIAEHLAKDGNNVYGFARRFEANPVANDDLFMKRSLDVTDSEAVKNAFDSLSDIDAFVYSAGGALFSEPMDTSQEDLDAMWKVHVSGAWACFENIFPKLVRETSIAIAVGSIAGTMYTPGCMAYAMAKTAQRVLWEHMVAPCRERGVRTTYVALGAVDTPLWDPIKNTSRQGMLNAQDVAQKVVQCIHEPSLHTPELTILPKKGLIER